MRICSPQLALHEASAFGGSVFDRELLRAIATEGVTVDLPIVEPPRYDVPSNWCVRQLPARLGFRGARLALQPMFFAAIVRASRQERLDAVRVFEASYTGPAALTARGLTGVPVVCHVHHVDNDVSKWQRRVEAVVARRSDAVFALSAFAAGQLAELYGVDASRIHIVPGGVAERFRPGPKLALPNSLRLKPDTRVVLSVSIQRRRKNLASLLRSFAQAFRIDDNAVLVVAGPPYGGDPGHGDQLIALATALGIADRFRLVGEVSEEEKLALYRRADVYASTSTREGFGLAVAEALSCGVPVVAMEGGALGELIRYAGGVVVRDGDEEGMGSALRRVAMLPAPDRKVMSDAAERVGASYTWAAAARAFLDVVTGLGRR